MKNIVVKNLKMTFSIYQSLVASLLVRLAQ